MAEHLNFPHSRALGRSLKVLELLSEKGGMTDQQIALALGYKLLTVQQLLAVYRHYGYVSCNAKGVYDLSVKVLDIGTKYSQRKRVNDIAQSFLRRLSLKFNETTTLGAIEGTDLIYLEKVESSEMLRFAPKKEQRITAHHTALGKSILAHLPELELEKYCRNVSWHAITAKTITSKESLLPKLAQIRKQGYAICDEEYCIGVRSIARVILDKSNYPQYSIGIWGPVERMAPNLLRKMQADLTVTSREISTYLNTQASIPGMHPAVAAPLQSTAKVDPVKRIRIGRDEPEKGFLRRAAALFL